MSNAAIALWMFALFLFLFGVVFDLLGMNSERSYWRQRDPSGNARADATPLAHVVARAGHYAAGEYRAPLRVAAIGVLLWYVALGFAVIALVVTVLA